MFQIETVGLVHSRSIPYRQHTMRIFGGPVKLARVFAEKRTKVSCHIDGHVEELRFERYTGRALLFTAVSYPYLPSSSFSSWGVRTLELFIFMSSMMIEAK